MAMDASLTALCLNLLLAIFATISLAAHWVDINGHGLSLWDTTSHDKRLGATKAFVILGFVTAALAAGLTAFAFHKKRRLPWQLASVADAFVLVFAAASVAWFSSIFNHVTTKPYGAGFVFAVISVLVSMPAFFLCRIAIPDDDADEGAYGLGASGPEHNEEYAKIQ